MIRLPEIKTADLSTYGNSAKALFCVPHVGLGTRLPRPHPLARKNSLVNQVKLVGLEAHYGSTLLKPHSPSTSLVCSLSEPITQWWRQCVNRAL